MTTKQKLSDVIQVNPRRQLKKGNIAPFVAMENIVPYEKQISEYTQRKISGSNSKFKNGDTLLAKITPSLENGNNFFEINSALKYDQKVKGGIDCSDNFDSSNVFVVILKIKVSATSRSESFTIDAYFGIM